MQTVIIVIHLMIVIAMIAVILLQRSEGGGLGIGGGGGGMFTARGSANLLTRSTTILAAVFFATSLLLGILAKEHANRPSILDTGAPSDAVAPAGLPANDTSRGSGQGILDALRQESGPAAIPAPPTDDGAAAPAPAPAAPSAPQVPTSE
jgi:preprotein translocase subunit SecG